MRGAFVSLAVLPILANADVNGCDSPLIDTVLGLFNVSSIEDLPKTLVDDVQNLCANGHCPQVTLPGCDTQSIDDVTCEVPLFDVPVKIGTDTICNTACDDWPCKVACQGIDVGICWGSDFVLCKAGCLVGGIFEKHCVDKCEAAIVEPCKQHLIDDCSDGCEKVFASCKTGCEKELTLQITASFEHLAHVVSSLEVSNFDLDCHGNGLTKPLVFNATTSAGIESLDMDLKIHTKDLSIGTTTTISLQQLKTELTLPINGSIQCGLLPKQKNIDIHIGDSVIDAFDLNFDVNNKAFETAASIICLDLPFCKDIIQDAIDGALKDTIKLIVPGVMAKAIAPIMQPIVDKYAKCPKVVEENEENLIVA